MTRKRFVKLAMSRGVPRNDAEGIARMASGAVSHAEIFDTVTAIAELIRPVVEAISEWISELDPETLKELAKLDED